jgi:hypothetical protein
VLHALASDRFGDSGRVEDVAVKDMIWTFPGPSKISGEAHRIEKILARAQGVPKDFVSLLLHLIEFGERAALPYDGDHIHQTVSERRIVHPFISMEITSKPGATRCETRQHHQSQPHEVAIALKERSLVPIDICRSARVGRDRNGSIGVGHLDVCDTWKFLLQKMADCEQLCGEGSYGELGQRLSCDDEMIDTKGTPDQRPKKKPS